MWNATQTVADAWFGEAPSRVPEGALVPLDGVRDNPGQLKAWSYVPPGLTEPAALVVVLHGCGQSAALYDRGARWTALARRHGFALLFPEQSRINNSGLCFNWFTAGDSQRGMGEPASIRAMIAAMAKEVRIDRSRIFVTGLSAGGAMASVMLATYPELFAAGAIIAGIPYGCAADLSSAFQCMGGHGGLSDAELVANVRRASPHNGSWPRVSVWHGTEDETVAPNNADAIVRQWTALHGLGVEPDRVERGGAFLREIWLGEDGRPEVERYAIPGMAHGVPVARRDAPPVDHMLEVGVDSTRRIAGFFGLVGAADKD